MTEIDFRSALSRKPLIAILRGIRPDEAVAIGQSLVSAGFSIIEVPLNSPDPFDSIERLADALPGTLVGAGTVMTPEDVRRVSDANGRLIVMPHCDTTVVRAAKEAGLVCVPGVATPTEAFAAIAAGADGLKLFPAEASSPAALSALRAVLPQDLPTLPVGGIRHDNMAPWVEAGAAGFGLGSSLYRPGDTAEQVAAAASLFSDAHSA